MYSNKLSVLLFFCCALICASQENNEGMTKSTTKVPVTSTTPVTSSTPLTSTTPATTKPTTPIPTTLKPTTPSTTTTTTTTSTTPEPPKTTTPTPVPYPEPSIGTWNCSCILIKMATQLNFTYKTENNRTVNTLLNVPTDATVGHEDCSSNLTQMIQLNWGPVDNESVMVLQFDKINNTVQMVMIKITLPMPSENFSSPNFEGNPIIQLVHRGKDFSSPAAMSYHCTRAQKFNVTETVADSIVVGFVKMQNVQTEAFRQANAKGFSEARDCDGTESSDVVPIAVGIALVLLILVVLISYLCARRRSIVRGYMSF